MPFSLFLPTFGIQNNLTVSEKKQISNDGNISLIHHSLTFEGCELRFSLWQNGKVYENGMSAVESIK